MVDGLGASQNTRKSTVKPPIPAFSITSQHKGILEEQGLLPFLKTDYLAIDWQDEVFGSLDGPDTWYEFWLSQDDQKCFSIHTSHLTNQRRLIPEICRELGLVAFDGQTYTLIGA